MAFIILVKNPSLSDKQEAYLRYAVRRVPPKEIAIRLEYRHVGSVYELDRRLHQLFEDLVEHVDEEFEQMAGNQNSPLLSAYI